MQSLFEFLVQVINNYINGLDLFWDSFEWFLSPNTDAKYFAFLVQGILIEDQ